MVSNTEKLDIQNFSIQVRQAAASEIDWVNQKYDEVKFKHSNFDNDIVVIAEIDGKPAGLGRLQKVDSECAELGGMYVFESFRRLGVAEHIVDFLLTQATDYKRLVCLPFEYIAHFYRRFGFSEIELSNQRDTFDIPQKMITKQQWCNEFLFRQNTLIWTRTRE